MATNGNLFGITMGDSSGVGPEILLKAYAARQLQEPVLAYGDLGALEYYNRKLDYGVPLRAVKLPTDSLRGRSTSSTTPFCGRAMSPPGS